VAGPPDTLRPAGCARVARGIGGTVRVVQIVVGRRRGSLCLWVWPTSSRFTPVRGAAAGGTCLLRAATRDESLRHPDDIAAMPHADAPRTPEPRVCRTAMTCTWTIARST